LIRALGPAEGTALNMKETTDAEALLIRKEGSKGQLGSQGTAPAFTPVSDQTVSERERVTFTVTASDPDGGALTYEAAGLPRYATFDSVEQRFTWRPRPGQDGTWAIAFTATNAQGAASTLVVRIKVRALERSPLEVALDLRTPRT
jgi:hypothetical protein